MNHTQTKSDRAPWLLLPGMLLTLGGVSVLAPHPVALAAAPAHSQPLPKPVVEGDGDGDELLEHWGDAQYAREERIQMAGAAAGFLLLGGLTWRKRSQKGFTTEAAETVAADAPMRKAA